MDRSSYEVQVEVDTARTNKAPDELVEEFPSRYPARIDGDTLTVTVTTFSESGRHAFRQGADLVEAIIAAGPAPEASVEKVTTESLTASDA